MSSNELNLSGSVLSSPLSTSLYERLLEGLGDDAIGELLWEFTLVETPEGSGQQSEDVPITENIGEVPGCHGAQPDPSSASEENSPGYSRPRRQNCWRILMSPHLSPVVPLSGGLNSSMDPLRSSWEDSGMGNVYIPWVEEGESQNPTLVSSTECLPAPSPSPRTTQIRTTIQRADRDTDPSSARKPSE